MKLFGLPTLASKIWTGPELKAKPKVTLSMCAHRKGDLNIIKNVLGALSSPGFDFSWSPLIGEPDICHARSRIATHFYTKTDDEVLVFIDDDVDFKESDLKKIINHVLDGKLICGGMYVQKGTCKGTLMMEEGDSIVFSADSPPKKIVAIPTGFMAIHRKVFDVLAKAKTPSGEPLVPLCDEGQSFECYPFFLSQKMKVEGKWRFPYEDHAFCLLARMCGIPSWVDPSLFLGHIGNYTYDLRDRVKPEKQSWEGFNLTLD